MNCTIGYRDISWPFVAKCGHIVKQYFAKLFSCENAIFRHIIFKVRFYPEYMLFCFNQWRSQGMYGRTTQGFVFDLSSYSRATFSDLYLNFNYNICPVYPNSLVTKAVAPLRYEAPTFCCALNCVAHEHTE